MFTRPLILLALFLSVAYSQSPCNLTLSRRGSLTVSSSIDTVDILHNLNIENIIWISGSSASYNLTVTTSEANFFTNRFTFSQSTSGSSVSAILYANLKGLGGANTSPISGANASGINLSLAFFLIASLGIFSSSMSASKRILVFFGLFFLFCAVVKAQTNCTTMSLVVTVPSTIHEVCENGACKCAPGWTGSDCNTVVTTPTGTTPANTSTPATSRTQTTRAPTPTSTQTTTAPTEAPVTQAPPTEAPITQAPPTEAPVTQAPPTEAPVTEAPPTEAPVTQAPPTEAPVDPGNDKK